MAFFSSSTDAFRSFVPVTVNFRMDDVLPQLLRIENQLLPKFLGDTLTDQLLALGAGQPPTDRYLKQALYLVKVAVARIGFAQYLPFAEVQIGNDGVTISANENRKAAFEYQTKALSKSLLDEGWRSLDELIALVSSQAGLFPGWLDSPYYQEHQEALFKSAAEFSRYYPIQDRWLTFWALRPFIRAVEDNQGSSAQERIDALPTSVTDGQKKKLTTKLLRALAYQAVLEALPNLSVELNGANVQVNYASQYGTLNYFQAPGKDHLSWVMQNLQNQLNLAWSSFETELSSLLPSSDSNSEGDGLIYGNGAITML